MTTKKKNVIVEMAEREKKQQELLDHCFENGWTSHAGNPKILLKMPTDGSLMCRVDFSDDRILRMGQKRPLTDEEKETDPHRSVKWETISEARYEDVVIENNALHFKQKQDASTQTKEG